MIKKKTLIKYSLTVLVGTTLVFTSCKRKGCTDPNATNYSEKAKKDDGTCQYLQNNTGMDTATVIYNGTSYIKITGTITKNNTLTAGTNWLLSGGVFVESGITLTIDAGTNIYAANDGTTPFLSIKQGGKINACGTATSPIVFTPAKTNPSPGDWGGIILNGYAQINTGTTAQGEGGTGIYGGSNDADNSGSMCYLRVEYAGKILGTNNELNGFSFNGVGSGTSLHHLQAYMGADDGFEFFGGTASIKHCVSTGNQDDSFDWTHGWRGNAQFLVVEQSALAGDRGFEGDNNSANNTATPYSDPTISNVTLIGADDGDLTNQAMKLRVGTKGNFYNFLVTGFPKRGIQIEHDATISNMNNQVLNVFNSSIDNINPFVFTSSAGIDTTVTNMVNQTAYNNATASNGSLVNFLNGYIGTDATNAYDPTILGSWFDAATYKGAVTTTNNWTIGWTKAL